MNWWTLRCGSDPNVVAAKPAKSERDHADQRS